MTCVSCQNRIEQKLRNIAGVVKASVSYAAGTADITYDTDVLSLRDIVRAIERLDYEVLPERDSGHPDIGRMVCTLAVIMCLYILLQQFGILNLLVPGRLADTTAGYGMLFVIGLATSVHCIAMCGGIGLSQCVPRADTHARRGSAVSALAPAVLYNLGRVISYTAAGFLLGLAGLVIGGGGQVGLPALFQGVLKLIAGTFMVIMGINMLGLFPWLRALTPRPPKFLAAKIGAQKAKAARPLAVGLLNGLMPCGPLQSMQIVALASGNPLAGALSMLLFSLGTVPLMLGLGSIVSALGKRFAHAVTQAGAVLVAVLGLAMLSQGGSLSGLLQPYQLLLLVAALSVLGVVLSLPASGGVRRRAGLAAMAAAALILLSRANWFGTGSGAEAADDTSVPELADGVQVVTSTLSPGSYPSITVQAGIPVRWVIDAPAGSINGCNYRMLLREYGIEHTFQEGENTIEFTPAQAGTYPYSCWMGMIRGNIFVTAADGTDSTDSVPVPAGYQIPSDELAVAEITADENGGAVQHVTIHLTENGFQPAAVVVQRDVPALWTIQNSLTSAGGAQLLAPYYSTALDLAQGGNPLSLYPSESFAVSTGDNAFYAYVKVVEDIKEIDAPSIQAEVRRFQPVIYPPEIFSAAGAAASCCGQ